jgi:hypothetical protein
MATLLDHEGTWLDNERFLIHTTYDMGPLLIHVGQENTHVAAVAADLFGRLDLIDYQNTSPAPSASGASNPITGNYTLLLQQWIRHEDSAQEGDDDPLLYHSATGLVEPLPIPVAVSPVINGQWLGLFELDSGAYPDSATYTVRLRPLEPPGNDNYYTYSGPNWPFFNADWSRMAVIGNGRVAIHSVPDWHIRSEWTANGYQLGGMIHRSPSGRWLLISGTQSDSSLEGLFVIPFE